MLNPQGITTREVCATIIMRFQGGEYIETEAGPGGFVNPCPGANYVSSEFGYRVSPTAVSYTHLLMWLVLKDIWYTMATHGEPFPILLTGRCGLRSRWGNICFVMRYIIRTEA